SRNRAEFTFFIARGNTPAMRLPGVAKWVVPSCVPVVHLHNAAQTLQIQRWCFLTWVECSSAPERFGSRQLDVVVRSRIKNRPGLAYLSLSSTVIRPNLVVALLIAYFASGSTANAQRSNLDQLKACAAPIADS